MHGTDDRRSSPLRHASRAALAGCVAGVALTALIVAATLGVSMAQDRSWGLAFVARATVSETSYSIATGVGVLLVPLALAALAAAAALVLPAPRRLP